MAHLQDLLSTKTLCSPPRKELILGIKKSEEHSEPILSMVPSASVSRPSTFKDPVLKRPGMQSLSNLLSTLPAAPAPAEVLQISALSINNVSTIEEYVVRTEHRYAESDPCAEHALLPQRKDHFVSLDQLTMSSAVDTAHGVACPWKSHAELLPHHESGLASARAPSISGRISLLSTPNSIYRFSEWTHFAGAGAPKVSGNMVDEARSGRPSVLPELDATLRPDEHAGALTDRIFSSARMHGSPRKPIYSGCAISLPCLFREFYKMEHFRALQVCKTQCMSALTLMFASRAGFGRRKSEVPKPRSDEKAL